MNRTIVLMLTCVAALTAILSGDAQAQFRGEDRAFDEYSLIVQRNIFSRNRSQYTGFRGGPSFGGGGGGAPYRAEQSYVLTGVTEQEQGFAAFIEDARRGMTTRVRAGDAVASGKITEIGKDWVQYEAGGRVTRVEVGMNLDRGFGAAVVADATTQPTTSSVTASSDDGGGDILEKMRKRRMAELGKAP